ncbi:hypothetical protein L3Q82_020384 [Scortum barcoo]|uniref:Uncharacterized protein n=1 Tax=Scortum barcoo TaxID=214431 RepID=A0ACB8V869_9TELE|nr:hypothetical protein L3Q82_020384 [Scortum barcoo]
MILFWVMLLLLLHQGYSLVPETTVHQLGEPATFTCDSPGYESWEMGARLYWYKQSDRDALKLIVTLMKNTNQEYGPEFSGRVEVKAADISSLTILRTIQEDEGMYHCGVTEWNPNILTQSLCFTGNTQRTSNYTVVQWPTVSDSVRPGDLMTLQCSVLSDSENKTCPGDHNVYWFKTGSDINLIQTSSTLMETHMMNVARDLTQIRKAVFIASLRASAPLMLGLTTVLWPHVGRYYLGMELKWTLRNPQILEFIALVISLICLIISVTGNIVFICYQSSKTSM